MNIAITDNTFNFAGGEEAINVEQGYVGAATTRATITGNDIDLQLQFGGPTPDNGILAISGVQASGAGSFLDLNIGGSGALANVINHSLGTFSTGGDIHVSQRFANDIKLDGYTGGATNTFAVANYLTVRNIEFEEPTASIEGGRFFGGASSAFVTVSVSAASVAEDGITNLLYTFTRNGSTAAPLVANFAITGTAAASDFGVTGANTYNAGTGLGTVTFLSGRATTEITVAPTGDGTAEADESVVVDAGNSATANGSFARAFITNDDAPLFLTAVPGGVQPADRQLAADGDLNVDGSSDLLSLHSDGFKQAAGNSQSAPRPVEADLIQSDLDAVVAAALARWNAAGLTADQTARLRSLRFEVTALGDLHLGEAGGEIIRVDTEPPARAGSSTRTPWTMRSLRATSAARASTPIPPARRRGAWTC